MRQTVAIASGLTTASIFLLGGVVTLAFAAVLVAISVAWVLSASRHSSVRTASVFAPVAMALAFGFVFDVDSDVSGLAFLALLAAALISATASRQTGFRLKLTETVMLGAVAGVCLVIGSYLAYTFGGMVVNNTSAINGSDVSEKEGGWQVEYEDEDRVVHEIFESELDKHGAACKMKHFIPYCTGEAGPTTIDQRD